MDAFYSLVKKSNTSDNQSVFNAAFKVDRSMMHKMENILLDQDIDYMNSSAAAYLNEDINDEAKHFTIKHDESKFGIIVWS